MNLASNIGRKIRIFQVSKFIFSTDFHCTSRLKKPGSEAKCINTYMYSSSEFIALFSCCSFSAWKFISNGLVGTIKGFWDYVRWPGPILSSRWYFSLFIHTSSHSYSRPYNFCAYQSQQTSAKLANSRLAAKKSKRWRGYIRSLSWTNR